MSYNYRRRHWPFVLAALSVREDETIVRVLLRSRTPEVASRFAPALRRQLAAGEQLELLDLSKDKDIRL